MHVIEDSRRFARSKGNALRGVTLKVSPKRLTLYHSRVSSQCQGSSHSRMNLLRSKDVVFVSYAWLLHTTTRYGNAESNPTETPIVYRFTQKSQKNTEKGLFRNYSFTKRYYNYTKLHSIMQIITQKLSVSPIAAELKRLKCL